jgi:hypothetical protein
VVNTCLACMRTKVWSQHHKKNKNKKVNKTNKLQNYKSNKMSKSTKSEVKYVVKENHSTNAIPMRQQTIIIWSWRLARTETVSPTGRGEMTCWSSGPQWT